MLKDNIVFKIITLFILPYIFLYGLYIQINGETSPGGGFQAGVIFASGLIGFDLIYGKNLSTKYFSIDMLLIIAVLGVVIYGATGAMSLIFNQKYLDYSYLCNDKILAETIGISIVEIGVGLTVSATMSLIYYLFQ